MSSRRPRGSKASRWDKEESSREHMRPTGEQRPKGPAGLIFMCNSRTKRDCFHYQVLGLPLAKKDLVEQVVPGIFLFLFDIDVRELHGIFEASSHGGLNLEPKAFQGQGSYPAQVRFGIYRECLPLSETVFKDVIQENYYARNKFHHELTSDQVSKLVQLFSPIEAPRKRLHVSSTSGVMQEAEAHRLGLLERTISVPGGVELANRFSQYRLPAPGIRVEERPPRHDPALRLEPRPLAVDAVERPHLPQTRVLDARADQKDLLTQGRLEEVDQLALKYLQPGNPTVGRALDSLHRNAGLPSMEAQRAISGLQQQEAILRSRALEAGRSRVLEAERSRALEAEQLRRAAAERAILREQGSSHHATGPSRAVTSFTAARRQPVGVSGPSRQSADIRRRR